MRLVRSRVRELEERLAELEQARADDLEAAASVVEDLRSHDRAAVYRLNGQEDGLAELRQNLQARFGDAGF